MGLTASARHEGADGTDSRFDAGSRYQPVFELTKAFRDGYRGAENPTPDGAVTWADHGGFSRSRSSC